MEPTTDNTDQPTPEQIEAAAKTDAEFSAELASLIEAGKTEEEARDILGHIVPDRRAPLDEPQLIALADAEATGALPEVDRRAAEKPSLADVSLEEPPIEPSSEGGKTEEPTGDIKGSLAADPEIPAPVRASLHRIHDILDHLTKQIDPVERILVHELRQILSDLGLPDRSE